MYADSFFRDTTRILSREENKALAELLSFTVFDKNQLNWILGWLFLKFLWFLGYTVLKLLLFFPDFFSNFQ